MIGKCVDCGKEGNVVRHHVCYSPEMLHMVCRPCHGKYHGKGKTPEFKLEYQWFAGIGRFFKEESK